MSAQAEGVPTVAFDVTQMAGVRTGIGLAVAEMLQALGLAENGPRLLPFAYGASVRSGADGIPAGTRIMRAPTRALLWAWARADLPRLSRSVAGAEVVHATAFVAPPSRAPTLVTIHDCAFARSPSTEGRRVGASFGPILRRAVARGAHVHTSTAAVAAEVEDLFGRPMRIEGKLTVIPFGFPSLAHAGPLPAAIVERLAGEPYVLALGSLVPRKNLPSLVRAFAATDLGEMRLVLAGPDGPDRPSIDAAIASAPSGVRDRIVLAGPVTEGARTTLLRGASALAYPSRYEGFGFPMLEAMSVGVPVVASDVPALREVAGDAALLVAPGDEPALGEALQRALGDEATRASLADRGRRRAATFTWSRTASELVELYRRVAEASTSS